MWPWKYNNKPREYNEFTLAYWLGVCDIICSEIYDQSITEGRASGDILTLVPPTMHVGRPTWTRGWNLGFPKSTLIYPNYVLKYADIRANEI